MPGGYKYHDGSHSVSRSNHIGRGKPGMCHHGRPTSEHFTNYPGHVDADKDGYPHNHKYRHKAHDKHDDNPHHSGNHSSGPHYSGAAQDTKKNSPAGEKVHKVMHEFKHGELHSGSKHGPKVTSRKQAIAIALSEQRNANK